MVEVVNTGFYKAGPYLLQLDTLLRNEDCRLSAGTRTKPSLWLRLRTRWHIY